MVLGIGFEALKVHTRHSLSLPSTYGPDMNSQLLLEALFLLASHHASDCDGRELTL